MISACMTVSVRELRTAVREWACCIFRIGYIDGIKRILYENIVFLRNVESSLYRDATSFLVQTE